MHYSRLETALVGALLILVGISFLVAAMLLVTSGGIWLPLLAAFIVASYHVGKAWLNWK